MPVSPSRSEPIWGEARAIARAISGVAGLVRLLDDLQAIADRIGYVEAADVRKIGVPLRRVAGFGQPLGERVEIGHAQPRMRLAGGAEVALDAEMDFHRPAAQP